MRSKQSKTLCLCGEIFIIHCLVFIAEDINQFKNLFVAQLKNMLSADELGAFILVLANSHQDTFLENELQDALTSTFVALKDNFVAGRLNATRDDSDVFKQLLDVDLFPCLPVWRHILESKGRC